MPKIIRDFDEFLEQVRDLHAQIETARKKRRDEYKAIGCEVPKRISFEELDLHALRDKLLSIHKTLQWRGHNDQMRRYHQNTELPKARTVAIAGICELIKDEYVGKFWDLYSRVIGHGWKADSTVYDWIWEKGFAEEGIELIQSDFRREFVQTLVLESGVPRNRAREIVDFFVLYWRYFSDTDDIEEIINGFNQGHLQGEHIPQKDRDHLIAICRDAAEFSKAFALAVSKLSRILHFIEDCHDIIGGNIDDHVSVIREKTGINPLEVLRDIDQLGKIYQMILGLVTPNKLIKILQSRSPGTSIRTPDGNTVRVDHYTAIQFGSHILQGVGFTCVPVTGVDLNYLDELPFNRVIHSGHNIYLKSRSEIKVTIGGRLCTNVVHPYFRPEFAGNIFHTRLQPATSISISTDDGVVNENVSSGDGFRCEPWLHYSGSPRRNEHHLYAGFSSCHLVTAENPDSKFQLFAGDSSEPLATLETDADGFAFCAERQIPINNPAPGEILFRVAKSRTGDTISFAGGRAEILLLLPAALLFNPYAGWTLEPCERGRSRRYGSSTFVLFTARDETGNLALQNMTETDRSELGKYVIRVLKWENAGKPAGIEYTLAEKTFSWEFEKCLHFSLYLNRSKDPSPTGFSFSKQQGLSIKDFSMVLNPVPPEAIRPDLYWNLIVNSSPPAHIPFAGAPLGREEGSSLKFSGEDLEQLVGNALERYAGKGAASVEISLCSMDSVFSTIRLWLFPGLKMLVPAALKDGDDFRITVEMAGGIKLDALMKDKRGNSIVRQKIVFEAGKWRLADKEYSATVELEQIGTSINLKSRPPAYGFRIGNRKTGDTEPVRDLLRRELDSLDFLFLGNEAKPPKTFIDEKETELDFERSGKIMHAPLGSLSGIRQHRHNIRMEAKGATTEFQIRYRIALLAADFHDNLIDRSVQGRIGFRGPVDSCLEFVVYASPIAGTGQIVGRKTIFCDGNVHDNYPVEIALTDTEISGEPYRVELLLQENYVGSLVATHKYGETWHVRSEAEDDAQCAVFLIEQARQALADGLFFMARRCLKRAVTILSAEEKPEIKQLWQATESGILEKKLHDIAAQASLVIRKEFLMKTSTFK